MTPKEIAAEFGTTGKTFRKFARNEESGIAHLAPGKGGRWAIPASKANLSKLQKRFDAWKAAEAAKRAEALANAENAEVDAVEEEVLDEVETLEDGNDAETGEDAENDEEVLIED